MGAEKLVDGDIRELFNFVFLDKYKYLISDLDGTLIDKSMEFIKHYTNIFLKGFGIELSESEINDYLMKPEYVRSDILETWGINPKEFGAKWRQEEILEIRKNKYTHIFPDVRALVDIKKRGAKLGIVTRAYKALSDMEVSVLENLLGEKGLFETVINVERALGIPKNKGLQMCAERLGAKDPSEVLTIGNEAEDADEAKLAGYSAIIIERPSYRLPPEVRKVDSLYSLVNHF